MVDSATFGIISSKLTKYNLKNFNSSLNHQIVIIKNRAKLKLLSNYEVSFPSMASTCIAWYGIETMTKIDT